MRTSSAPDTTYYLWKGRAVYPKRLARLEPFLVKPAGIPECYNSRVHKSFTKPQRKWCGKEIAEVTATREKSWDREPLNSVITEVRNNAPGLSWPFQKIFDQTHKSIELMRVDCGSGTRSHDSTGQYAGSIDIILGAEGETRCDFLASETGQYGFFLDLGTEFADLIFFLDAFQDAPEAAVVTCGHGYHLNSEDPVSLRCPQSLGIEIVSEVSIIHGANTVTNQLGNGAASLLEVNGIALLNGISTISQDPFSSENPIRRN